VQNNAVITPRVLNSTTNRLRSILEENEIFPNGTEIMKKFNGNKIYRGSEMILTVHSDAAHLVAAKAIRSRAAGYHFFGNKDGKLFKWSDICISKNSKKCNGISHRSRNRWFIYECPRSSTRNLI
jgi:hypothetical protein